MPGFHTLSFQVFSSSPSLLGFKIQNKTVDGQLKCNHETSACDKSAHSNCSVDNCRATRSRIFRRLKIDNIANFPKTTTERTTWENRLLFNTYWSPLLCIVPLESRSLTVSALMNFISQLFGANRAQRRSWVIGLCAQICTAQRPACWTMEYVVNW